MSQILQVDVSGTPQNIAEQTEADSTKYGARTVDIDARTKLEAIRALLDAGISVSIGDVNLSAATLTELENVVVSGTVGLDSASLSALESVTVSGTVALDAATLSALETVTVAVSGDVALNATTLAALETISVANFPATQDVSGTVAVSNLPAIQAVSGTVEVSNFPATQPVSGTVDISDPFALEATQADILSELQQKTEPATAQNISYPATPTVTSVTSAATDTVLLAANTSRKAAYFYNDSSSALYLKFGTGATTSSFTIKLAANSFYEMPISPVYTGAIHGIWVSASGAVRVTELA